MEIELLRTSTFVAESTEPGTVEIVREETRETSGGGTGDGFRVILYDDDWHSQDEVIRQVQKATSCSEHKAILITMEAHHKGRAICYRGAREECHRVAGVLREIRLQVEVDCD